MAAICVIRIGIVIGKVFSFEETVVFNVVVGNVRHGQTDTIKIARILERHLLVQVDLLSMLVLVIFIAVRYVAFRCMTSPVTPAYGCGLNMLSLLACWI